MPANIRTPEPFDYSDDLTAGRADVQSDCHRFFDTLFEGMDVLDVGAGLGKSKERIVRNRVTTWDIDARMSKFCDLAGGRMPGLPEVFDSITNPAFDVVTAFDVVEHLPDDVSFVVDLYKRARRAIFFTTPNWHITRCNEKKGGSTHHWPEYDRPELHALLQAVRVHVGVGRDLILACYKDSTGSWWELPAYRPDTAWLQARRFGVLMAPRWTEIVHVSEMMHAIGRTERTPG